MWYDKQKLDWNIMPDDWMIRRLMLPEGQLDMVLDTDTYNEVDDQFALAYSLLSPERLNIEAIYAAPFYNKNSSGAEDGMEKSYDEILRMLSKMNRSPDGFVFKGSREYMRDDRTPVDSPAARDLVARAIARGDDDPPLYVAAIGAITNIASALLIEPALTQKIVVVWLGGQPTSFPFAKEFNLSQDVFAANTVLDSGVPFVYIPCLGVASHTLSTVPELKEAIGGKNPLCDALIELFAAYESDHFGWAKEIWDVAVIGYLINPEWVPTKLVHSPMLTDDSHWAHDERRHLIREAYFCRRNPIFRDMFRKLANFDA
ncbi:MAG: nucleoside hydrolase [Candidatus Excrementavichristensenella sp.]|jgi:purine nucleosidase